MKFFDPLWSAAIYHLAILLAFISNSTSARQKSKLECEDHSALLGKVRVVCNRRVDTCGENRPCPGGLTCCPRACGRRCVCPRPVCSPDCVKGALCRHQWSPLARNPLTRHLLASSQRLEARCLSVPSPQCDKPCSAGERCLWDEIIYKVNRTLLGRCARLEAEDLIEGDDLDDCANHDEGMHALFVDQDLFEFSDDGVFHHDDDSDSDYDHDDDTDFEEDLLSRDDNHSFDYFDHFKSFKRIDTFDDNIETSGIGSQF